MFEITPYTPDQKSRWNDFVRRSKNSTFLHYTKLMEKGLSQKGDYFFDSPASFRKLEIRANY